MRDVLPAFDVMGNVSVTSHTRAAFGEWTAELKVHKQCGNGLSFIELTPEPRFNVSSLHLSTQYHPATPLVLRPRPRRNEKYGRISSDASLVREGQLSSTATLLQLMYHP